jgi:hypothetical protein
LVALEVAGKANSVARIKAEEALLQVPVVSVFVSIQNVDIKNLIKLEYPVIK